MENLRLHEILTPYWAQALTETIEASPRAIELLGHNRDVGIIPIRENIFKSLNNVIPEQVKVIIVADSPYPSLEKATGIACNDGSTVWEGNLSPTLRHVIQSALMHHKHCQRLDGGSVIRAALERLDMDNPQTWFNNTINSGVLWLNASLTRTADPHSVDAHFKFWKPILGQIVRTIAESKTALGADHPNRGLCIALWGSRAAKLTALLRRQCSGTPFRLVTNRYPPNVQRFLDRDNFGNINAALDQLRMHQITWIQDGEYVQLLARRRPREDGALDGPPLRVRRDERGERMAVALLGPPCEEASNEQESCAICMVNKINTVILDCAHVAVCSTCATMLRECPICRSRIQKIVRTYSAR